MLSTLPVPYYLEQELTRYINGGEVPSLFLRLVLEGRFYEALEMATPAEFLSLPNLISRIQLLAPLEAFGSGSKLIRWLARNWAPQASDSNDAWVPQ